MRTIFKVGQLVRVDPIVLHGRPDILYKILAMKTYKDSDFNEMGDDLLLEGREEFVSQKYRRLPKPISERRWQILRA